MGEIGRGQTHTSMYTTNRRRRKLGNKIQDRIYSTTTTDIDISSSSSKSSDCQCNRMFCLVVYVCPGLLIFFSTILTTCYQFVYPLPPFFPSFFQTNTNTTLLNRLLIPNYYFCNKNYIYSILMLIVVMSMMLMMVMMAMFGGGIYFVLKL